MIKEFVDTFMSNKDKLEAKFAEEHPESYTDIVKGVIEIISHGEDWDVPDHSRVHEIDDGDYQGTLVYVIAAKGYQPMDYWYVRVSYGSCSGCDTLQSIHGYEDGKPSEQQVKDYMTLALHVVQGLKKMGGDVA